MKLKEKYDSILVKKHALEYKINVHYLPLKHKSDYLVKQKKHEEYLLIYPLVKQLETEINDEYNKLIKLRNEFMKYYNLKMISKNIS